jgi:hypothetical protein
MPGLGPYPYRTGPAPGFGAPTLEDKLAAIRQKFPLAKFPSDFGSNPADMTAIDRLSSNAPQWLQKTGAAISDFFGAGKPNTNEMMSRVGSMKGTAGRSISDVQYSGLIRAGRLMTDHVLPIGQAGSSVARTVERAQQLYNKELPVIGMSTRGALSAKSMFSDVMEMSGYAPNPSGGYVQTRDVNKDVISAIYAEAAGRGLNPTEVAMEKMSTAVALENSDVQERIARDRPVPLWQDDRGVVLTDRDLEEGPNAASKVMRYVPKFMERNDQT